MDDPILQVAQSKFADIYVVSSNFISYGFGILFSPNISDQIVDQFSQGILTVNEKYPMEQRLKDYIDNHYITDNIDKPPLKKDSYG